MSFIYSKFIECGCRLVTDSRAISGGEMFLALKGDNFDGNDFALPSLEKGAAYAVVDAERFASADDPRLIKVADTQEALSALATEHRRNVSGEGRHLPVIGLTGTNGKTTTKELVCAVLGAKYRVAATKGNLNNDIGVPLTLLSFRPDTEIAVVEMGASHPDDITKLVRVAEPDYGLITNVGKAHLLGFGSFEGVKAAKGELYRYLSAHDGSVIFINEDDADLKGMASEAHCHFFGYGIEYQGVKILPGDRNHPFLSLDLGDCILRSHLVGAYNASNILCALAVGEYFGVKREDAVSAIENYVPSNNRSQLKTAGSNTLIIDAYNANPSSMSAALDNFFAIESGRKLLLLGDMRELGEGSVEEHLKIVRRIASEGVQACLVGEEFKKALAQVKAECIKWFDSSASLAEYLGKNVPSESLILIKGSRGIRMENVLEPLGD